MRRKSLLLCLYGVLTAAVFVYLKKQFTFGFVPLFILLGLFLLLPLLEKRFLGNEDADSRWKAVFTFIHVILIAVFGALSLVAFKNYVYPDEAIFRNSDYHALRVDGIELQNPRFTLAADDRDAFLDSPRFRGRLSVHSADSNGVILDMAGFSDPVYLISGKENRRFEMLEPDAFPSFRAGDTVQFVHGGGRVTSLCLRETFYQRPWHSFITKYFSKQIREGRDSIHYVFTMSDGQEQVSSESRFLRSGLPLSSIMADVTPDFDSKGIQIVRAKYDMDTKIREQREYYTNTTDRYYILVDKSATDISAIRINGRSQNLSSRFVSDTLRYGQPFAVGFGKNKSATLCFNWSDGRLRLEYYLPEYRYLTSNPSADDQSLMVTTTLFDAAEIRNDPNSGGLLSAYSDNIALFDEFERQDNIYQMNPWFLSYRSSKAGTPMSFTVYSDATYPGRISIDKYYLESKGTVGIPARKRGRAIPSEAYFQGISTRGGNAHWLVGVEDFSATTPFRADRLSLVILSIVLLSLFFVFYGRQGAVHNSIEYAVFLVTIAFVTVRCFLMWRTTVFPPVSSVSFYEFNHFRDTYFFRWLLRSIGIFYLVVLIFKLGIPGWLGGLSFRRSRRFSPSGRYHIKRSGSGFGPGAMALTMAAVYIFFLLVTEVVTMGERFTNILLPVSLFLVFEFLVYALYSNSYSDGRVSFSFDAEKGSAVFLSILNVLLASAYTFYKDGGFGVMFLLFGVYVIAFLVADYRYNLEGRTSIIVIVCRIFLYLTVIAFTLLYKFFFIWVLDYRLIFVGALFVVLCLVFFALSFVMEFNYSLKEKTCGIPNWLWSLVAIGICCGGVYIGAGHFVDGKHLEYRTRVHMASPSSILAEHVSDDASQNRFMQASLNDWILEEYETIGKDVHPFFEKGKGYFKLQPQSKLGAMWFAQSTDILLSRFIIAEHSEVLAILFIIAFLLLLLVAMSHSCLRRGYRVILFCVPMLFLVQCTLIWLANTRKFIFFGQDFPLLSTTSNLSSVFFFGLMGILLVFSYLETDYTLGAGTVTRMDLPDIDRNNARTSVHIRDAFLVAAFFFIVFGGIFRGKNSDPGEERDPGVYTVNPLMERTSAVIDSLNVNYFRPYQKTHRLRLASDMSGQLADFYRLINVPDSGFIAQTRKTNEFAAQMLDRYFRTDAHSNSIRKLMHVHTTRTYDSDGNPMDTLEFGLNSVYYYYRLPIKEKLAWTGSIIGRPDTLLTDPSFRRPGIAEFFRLDGKWLPDKRSRALVRAESGLRLVGETSIVDLSPGFLPVGVITTKDCILRGRNPISSEVIGEQEYFARNVMVNGQRTFIYPYGSRLFWIRDFASQIMMAKESLPEKDDGFNDDVPITLSSSLSSSIYGVYQGYGIPPSQDKAVVVADGNGMIRAMVDFRGDAEYRLNPNDSKRIYALLEDIYMNGDKGSPREQRYFSTFAADPLRLGPGSSQKPVVWTAVSAGYGGQRGFFADLMLDRLESQYFALDDNKMKPLEFPLYAGHPIEKIFTSKWADEGGGSVPVSLERYIYKSSNYFNSLMAYFGMLTPAQIDAMWEDGLFKDVSYNNSSSYKELFPIMRIPGKGRVSFQYFITIDDYLNQNALLPSGLETYFNLPSTRSRTGGLYSSVPKYVDDGKGNKVPRSSVFSNPSFFNMDIRAGRTTDRERNEYGVRSVAIGSTSAWSVSPVKMAEMYGRLLTLNHNYELTLDPSHSSAYEPFSVDSSWQDYRGSRVDFIYGLSEVFDPAVVGTCYYFDASLRSHNVGLDKKENGRAGRYYIYGKTGTINAKWNREKQEDHLLAVVITDRKISAETDLSKVKFFVVYFVDYANNVSHNWSSIDQRVLERIIDSDEFNAYMNN